MFINSISYTDLPTHPHFSGVTRILQKSPAHPDKVVNHPHYCGKIWL